MITFIAFFYLPITQVVLIHPLLECKEHLEVSYIEAYRITNETIGQFGYAMILMAFKTRYNA